MVVVQTPPSFGCTDEHESNLRELLDTVDRGGLTVAWEPRGDWPDHPDRVAAVCDDLDLVCVVDVMRDDPVADHDVAYTRLHGMNEDPYDYAYDYTDAELDELAGELECLAGDHERVYCLFNNDEMDANATALAERLRAG